MNFLPERATIPWQRWLLISRSLLLTVPLSCAMTTSRRSSMKWDMCSMDCSAEPSTLGSTGRQLPETLSRLLRRCLRIGNNHILRDNTLHIDGDCLRCWEPKVLEKMSSHYEKQEPLSSDLIDKIIKRSVFSVPGAIILPDSGTAATSTLGCFTCDSFSLQSSTSKFILTKVNGS